MEDIILKTMFCVITHLSVPQFGSAFLDSSKPRVITVENTESETVLKSMVDI